MQAPPSGPASFVRSVLQNPESFSIESRNGSMTVYYKDDGIMVSRRKFPQVATCITFTFHLQSHLPAC